MLQQTSAALQAAPQSALAPTELPRRLVLRLTLEVTQDQRSAADHGQPLQFLVQYGAQVGPGEAVAGISEDRGGPLPLAPASPCGLGACLVRDAQGDAV